MSLDTKNKNEGRVTPSSSVKSSMLSFKTMFLYPGIILSAGWTILNIVRIVGYVGQLKNERPECTASNPNREIVFSVTMLILFALKERIE